MNRYRKKDCIIADLVKQHTVIRSLTDEKRYIDSFAVVDPKNDNPVLSFIVDYLIDHAHTLTEDW